MPLYPLYRLISRESASPLLRRSIRLAGAASVALLVCLGISGCKTSQGPTLAELEKNSAQTGAAKQAEAMILHEGDVLRITFPGAPNLNTIQPIRRDGRIALPLVGECKAAGLTPSALEKELLKMYESQLQTKEVTVAVESSAFPVYVSGAVLKPGKITSDRPLNALEAIMEAGGFDYTKANLKSVKVIRHENGTVRHYTLNLKKVVQGQASETFELQPSDIIYVPERFSWF